MGKARSSIIYVNFSPYENAGKILDYLTSKFDKVVLFSFNFHRLGKKSEQNILNVYNKSKVVETKNLFDFKSPEKLIFILLPIRSSLIFAQLLFYCAYLRFKFGIFDYYLSVNAFTSWAGMIIKNIGFVRETYFWVWDYYPPYHQNKIIAFMRRLYCQFDKVAINSNQVIFLNKRMVNLHKKNKILSRSKKYKIIPIGTNPASHLKLGRAAKFTRNKKIKLAFLGVIKKSQGLDILFETSVENKLNALNVQLEVIGAGPELDYYKKRFKNSSYQYHLYGYQKDNQRDRILKNSDIGIATYVPSKDNVSYFGDPSKIKQYLSHGLPVITTNVFEFSKEIKAHRAGIIINYNKPEEFVKAFKSIINNYIRYRNGALRLANKYSYKTIYNKLI